MSIPGDRLGGHSAALGRGDHAQPRESPGAGVQRRRYRILLSPSAFYPHVGGIEELTRQLARSYRLAGHTVMVLAPRWPHALAPTEMVDGILVQRVPMPLPSRHRRSMASFLRRSIPAAARALFIGLRWRPDVVHLQGVGPNGIYGVLLAAACGASLVVTSQGEQTMDATRIYQRSPIQRWILRCALQRASAVTACSVDALTALRGYGSWSAQTAVVPNGVNPADIEGVRAAPTVQRRPFVFAVGRHVENKGFSVLLQAFASVATEYPEVELIVGGDGPHHGTLRELTASLGIADRVRFPGFLDRPAVADHFRQCALFVLPSYHEPFGIVVLEAMAAGKAVIATRAGGVPEFVEDGVQGILVPPRDPEAVAVALRRLLADAASAERMGAAGRRLVREQFTWEAISERYVALYAQTL